MSEGLSKKLAAKIRQLTFHWIQRDDWNEKDWPGLESQIVAVIQPELDRLRAQLAPSPCGVKGHLMLHWIEPGVQEGIPLKVSAHCPLCTHETRLLEDLRERAFEAGANWVRHGGSRILDEVVVALRSEP